jgi:hypothetical protein
MKEMIYFSLENEIIISVDKKNNQIDWIEKLLQTSIEDYRKKIVDLVLAPYLILIKKLSNEESFSIIYEWLQKCDLLSGRKLDFDIKDRIKVAIKNTNKKQIFPMKKIL